MPKPNEANEVSTITRSLTPFEQFELRRRQRRVHMRIAEDCLAIIDHEAVLSALEAEGVDATPLVELLEEKIVKMAETMRDTFGEDG